MCRVCLCHSMHHEIRRSSIDLKTERNELRLPGPLSGVSSQRTGSSVAKYANCGRRRSCNLQLNFWQGNCNANAQVPPRYLCTALFLSLRLWLLSLRLSHFHARKCPSRSYHSNWEVRERERERPIEVLLPSGPFMVFTCQICCQKHTLNIKGFIHSRRKWSQIFAPKFEPNMNYNRQGVE